MATFVFVFFGAVFYGLFGLFIGCSIGLFVPATEVDWACTETSSLASLQNNVEVEGDSFFVNDAISADQYYFFYTRAGEGVKPEKILADSKVTLFEDQKPGGELRVYSSRFKSRLLRGVALNWLRDKRYEISIPAGGLKKVSG